MKNMRRTTITEETDDVKIARLEVHFENVVESQNRLEKIEERHHNEVMKKLQEIASRTDTRLDVVEKRQEIVESDLKANGKDLAIVLIAEEKNTTFRKKAEWFFEYMNWIIGFFGTVGVGLVITAAYNLYQLLTGNIN